MASAALLQGRGFAQVGPNDKVIPWNDQPPPVPPPFASMAKGLTPWEELNSWITSNNKFFGVAHGPWPMAELASGH